METQQSKTARHSAKRHSEAGFTLVELAIVMIIIGLLIGGVLKGQELISSAQVSSTISQVKGIEAALSTFRDKYNALPGDMLNAQARLPGCTGSPCNAVRGNTLGNGVIDGNPGAAPAATSEGTVAFSQLAAADLITGVNVLSQSSAVNVGDEIPAGTIAGTSFRLGFAATSATGALNTTSWKSGHYLAIGPGISPATATTGSNALTPVEAARIDTKLDDGNPSLGSVRAAGPTTCISGRSTTAVYNESREQKDCSVFIRVQG